MSPEPREVLVSSKRFYKAHRLSAWVKGLPFNTSFSSSEIRRIQEAEALNLHQAFAFPGFQVQMNSIRDLIEETVHRPLSGLPPDPRLAPSFISDHAGEAPSGRVHQRRSPMGLREEGPYLLFFNMLESPVRESEKPGDQILAQFEQNGWSGLTVPEFLVLCRAWRESQLSSGASPGVRFSDYRWSWLVDSATGGKCSVAYWSLQTIGIFGCETHKAHRDWEAGRSVVVPLR